MGPEVSNSGSGTDAFAEMAASMPPYNEHIVSQVGSTPESPPTSVDESLSPNKPSTTGQNQTDPQSQQKPVITATSTTETPLSTTVTDTSETSETSETSKTTETTADFSPEELADIQSYIDKIETGAKKDLEMANLLHQFVEAASHQRSIVHQMPVPPATPTKPTPPPVAPGTPKSPSPTPEQPSPAPEPTIPDAATAIAEALAETANNSIPGQAPISTPLESPGINSPGIATRGIITGENSTAA